AILVYAFEHPTCLLMRQPGTDAAAQSSSTRQPGIADRTKTFGAPDLIPFGEVGGEVKQRIVRRWRQCAQGGKRGRGKFRVLGVSCQVHADANGEPWRRRVTLTGRFQQDAGDLPATSQNIVRPFDAKLR